MPKRSASPFPTPPLRWMLLGTVALGGLAGCGGGHHAAPTTTTTTSSTTTLAPTTSTTTSTTTAPATTAPTTTVQALHTCVPAQLTVTAGADQGAAGHVGRQFHLQNSSSTPCTLHGYPGLGLLGAGGKALPTTVVRQPGQPIATVTLAPGGSAYFTAVWASATGYANASCPTSTSLEITPPNNTTHLTVGGPAGTIQAYGGTTEHLQCGTITVTPVSATPTS